MGILTSLEDAHLVAHAHCPIAPAELGSKVFKTQVIGDFPEAEARLYLEQNMGASTTDAEWAHIFEVRLHA